MQCYQPATEHSRLHTELIDPKNQLDHSSEIQYLVAPLPTASVAWQSRDLTPVEQQYQPLSSMSEMHMIKTVITFYTDRTAAANGWEFGHVLDFIPRTSKRNTRWRTTCDVCRLELEQQSHLVRLPHVGGVTSVTLVTSGKTLIAAACRVLLLRRSINIWTLAS